MEYFAGGGGGNNPIDPYAVIPQQFGNGGVAPQQSQQVDAPDYETYQAQQQAQQAQYRAAQAQAQAQAQAVLQQQQQGGTMYYQTPNVQGSYFQIHPASDTDYLTDFLGPQHPPPPSGGQQSGAGGAGGAAPYQQQQGQQQQDAGANKNFILQHQQRRGGNQAAQQQQGQSSSQQQAAQGQQQRQMGGQSNQHFMHHQMQAVQQQQAQQQMHHRLQGAPITPQHQFMVPPPNMIQSQQQMQQQNQQQMHHLQMQMLQQQQQHQNQQHGQQQQYHHHQHHQQQQQHSQHHQGGHHQGGQQGQGHHQQQQHHAHHHQNSQHHQQQQHHHQGAHHQGGQQHNQQPPGGLQGMQPRPPQLRDWPIRCLVESRYYSVIMGPNASTIRDIAHSTHCRVEFVNMSRKERDFLGKNERILTIYGNAEQASKAVARILDVIQAEAIKDDVNVGADIVLRLRAHNQLCGRLIGKMGASIREIMQATGTSITVAKQIEPTEGFSGLRHEEILSLMERTIVVRGPSIEAVVQAESMISAKLKRCYESDTKLRAQSMQPGPMMPPMPLLPPQMPGVNGVSLPTLFPTAAGLVQVQHFIQTNPQAPNPSNTFLQPGMLQMHPGVISLRELHIWVPDNMVGALIGTKGKNIKMIIRETNATVRIESAEEKEVRDAKEAEKQRVLDEQAALAAADAELAGGDTSGEELEKISDREVTISGEDLEILKAQSFIFGKMSELSNQPPNMPENERTLKYRCELLVPTRIIGRLIGKGGCNVRELQRITGASVKIPEELRNETKLFRHADGFEEEMTLVRTHGTSQASHNAHFRLAHLISEYYRNGEHRQPLNNSGNSGRAPSAAAGGRISADASPLNNMGQLGQNLPVLPARNTPSNGSAKNKTP